MKRAEPAPTPEDAALDAAVARNILRQRPLVWICVFVALMSIVTIVTSPHWVSRLLAVVTLLGNLGFAAWHELNWRAAARSLDANRQRWGDV